MDKAETTKRTRHQRFESLEILRGQIKNAPYNPRRISVDARARLKGKIESVGLVNTLVWNKRSGNLVSGHQRLSILDELEGNANYTLHVSAVDVDERAEKELNVFVNNAGAMGEWDNVALAGLVKEFSQDLSDLGFAPGELDFLTESGGTVPDEEASDSGGGKDPRETQDGTQVVVVFRDAQETEAFLRFIGQPIDSRYCDGVKAFKAAGFNPKGV